MWNLDGPFFVRFASRLVYYEGAVVAKIRFDQKEREEGTTTGQQPANTQKMSMSQAMKNYGDELDALNYESEAGMAGTLFERVTVPAES